MGIKVNKCSNSGKVPKCVCVGGGGFFNDQQTRLTSKQF